MALFTVPMSSFSAIRVRDRYRPPPSPVPRNFAGEAVRVGARCCQGRGSSPWNRANHPPQGTAAIDRVAEGGKLGFAIGFVDEVDPVGRARAWPIREQRQAYATVDDVEQALGGGMSRPAKHRGKAIRRSGGRSMKKWRIEP